PGLVHPAVEEDAVAALERAQDVVLRRAELRTRARRKDRAPPRPASPRLDRLPLAGPLQEAAVEHAHLLVSVAVEAPDEPPRHQDDAVVVCDHGGVVADPGRLHRLTEAVVRGDLPGDGVV